jgi:lipoprotein signal peptidase
MLGVAIPLAVTDLVVKFEEPTAWWAYHQRSYGWLALSLALLALMFAIAQIPSRFVAPAAGILAAGILGNSLSAAWNGMEVPNPLVIGGEHAFIAFNLADVWALAGILALVCAIGVWLIQNRELLPQTAEFRASRGAAFRRLFQGEKP